MRGSYKARQQYGFHQVLASFDNSVMGIKMTGVIIIKAQSLNFMKELSHQIRTPVFYLGCLVVKYTQVSKLTFLGSSFFICKMKKS